MIIVAATLDFADQDSRDAVVAACAPVQLATRVDEPGCQAYCFAADPCVPNRIQVHECWDDEASLVAHFKHQNYAAMVTVLRAQGITAAWNQMYLVARNEPVYSATGAPREKFFVDEPQAES